MTLDQPFPELDELLATIGATGQRLGGIDASEGAAGNISMVIGWPLEVRRRFPMSEPFELPLPVPALAGHLVIVTGSGRRLRDIHLDPAANLAAVLISADGRAETLQTSPRRLFQQPTSEFNSHLAVHNDQVSRTGTNFHALIHAQPPHLVQQLLRWEPETIVNLPEGIGILPYKLPGSPAMMEANVAGLQQYRIVVWSKHGVMARSDLSVTRAADRIEYAETAAMYEYMNLVNGNRAEGLTRDELREVVQAFNVQTTLV
jgi:rhamnulose-1-phosphate aldolase